LSKRKQTKVIFSLPKKKKIRIANKNYEKYIRSKIYLTTNFKNRRKKNQTEEENVY
jgi:hypothetical protein